MVIDLTFGFLFRSMHSIPHLLQFRQGKGASHLRFKRWQWSQALLNYALLCRCVKDNFAVPDSSPFTSFVIVDMRGRQVADSVLYERFEVFDYRG